MNPVFVVKETFTLLRQVSLVLLFLVVGVALSLVALVHGWENYEAAPIQFELGRDHAGNSLSGRSRFVFFLVLESFFFAFFIKFFLNLFA